MVVNLTMTSFPESTLYWAFAIVIVKSNNIYAIQDVNFLKNCDIHNATYLRAKPVNLGQKMFLALLLHAKTGI